MDAAGATESMGKMDQGYDSKPAMVRVGDIDFAYLERGSGPLVLCLHGFPDTAYSFVPVLERLAAAGYRAVAPFMRGYYPTGLAPDGDYRLPAIARDVPGLIEALGAERAHLVGHDWGAATTYFAATMFPERIGAVVTAAIPHLRRFLLRPSLKQLRRSWYIGYFQWRRGPERRIVRDDFAWLDWLIREWSPGWRYTDDDMVPLHETLGRPDHCAAALGYYRALPRTLMQGDSWRTIRTPLPVPAKVIYGTEDGCIGPEMFEDQAYCYGAGLDLVCMKGAGHFMQCERPDRFADEVIGFLRRHPL